MVVNRELTNRYPKVNHKTKQGLVSLTRRFKKDEIGLVNNHGIGPVRDTNRFGFYKHVSRMIGLKNPVEERGQV